MREEAAAELVARARTDRAAFGEIYDLYLNRVYAFCLAHSDGRDEAEDLTALTFERALVAMPRYEDRGAPLSSWLLRIAANAAADRARRGCRVVTVGDDPLPEPEADTETRSGPAELVERWERAAWLRGHISTLPRDQQYALRLRYAEDKAILDIAEAMQRSEGAVKQLLQRAIKALRASIQQEGLADA